MAGGTAGASPGRTETSVPVDSTFSASCASVSLSPYNVNPTLLNSTSTSRPITSASAFHAIKRITPMCFSCWLNCTASSEALLLRDEVRDAHGLHVIRHFEIVAVGRNDLALGQPDLLLRLLHHHEPRFVRLAKNHHVNADCHVASPPQWSARTCRTACS